MQGLLVAATTKRTDSEHPFPPPPLPPDLSRKGRTLGRAVHSSPLPAQRNKTMATNYPMIPPQVWRQQGAPESVATVSQSFLSHLAVKLGLRNDPAAPSNDTSRRDDSLALITETEDHDCRIGEKARKRRREAQKVVKVPTQTGITLSGKYIT